MNFSSINFLFLFLPIFFPVYFLITPKCRNLILILFSFVFYYLGEKAFLILLLFSCVFNYIIGKNIEKTGKKTALIIGIMANVLLLAAFKYLNFFIEQINLLNIFPQIPNTKIHLPVGISFFTFQALSYLIDIYRKDIKASKLSDFALYLSLFPQLVAGPIVRYVEIQNEIIKRNISAENFEDGIKRFIAGLSKKVIIADTLSYTADNIFALGVNELSAPVCFLGAICYTFQIFFDFSGYSDMAIGLGKMLGFTFPENFNYPYISTSIKEFWRRWHITLSRWFRDYLYIPLGGNRKHVILNIIIVFMLTGLWHGANWNFIVWGLFNGALIALERTGFINKIPKPLQHIYFFFAIITGWVIFRSETLSYAADFLNKMYSMDSFFKATVHPAQTAVAGLLNIEVIFTLIIAVILSFPMLKKIEKYIPRFIKTAGYIILFIVSASYIAVNTYQPFIYFRF